MFKCAILLALAKVILASLTNCHYHGPTYYCVDSAGVEGYVTPAPASTDAPKSYTGCHNHGTETYCMYGDEEVLFLAEGGDDHGDDHGDEHGDHSSEDSGASEVQTTETTSSSSVTVPTSETAAAPALTTSDTLITSSVSTTQRPSVTNCHFHGLSLFCVDASSNEGYITPAPTTTPSSFTGCHAHGSETFCMDSSGEEVQFVPEGDDEHADGDHDHTNSTLSVTTLSQTNAGHKQIVQAMILVPLLALV